MTEKILLMSDIHITEPGVAIVGLNPALRFKRCLEHAAIHHSNASHLFIMGDLTHNGSYNEYIVLKEILSSQPFEATLMLGNHDRREPFAKTFNHLSEGFQHGKKPLVKPRSYILIHSMKEPKMSTVGLSVKSVCNGWKVICNLEMDPFYYYLTITCCFLGSTAWTRSG